MKRIVPVLLLLTVLTAAPAHAVNWSLGANLGLSMVMADDSDNDVTGWGWPSNVLPGIRVGFHGDNPKHEFYADNTWQVLDTDGASASEFSLTGNYQHNFKPAEKTGLYLTGGLGFVNQSVDLGPVDVGAMAPIFGGGVGLRYHMGDQGILRGEVRLDFRGEGEDDGVLVFDDATILSFKFGFDLWNR